MRPSFLDDMGWAMGEVYEAVTDRILINLAHYFRYLKPGEKIPGSFEYQARMLAQMGQVNRETAAIIAQYLGGADQALQDTLQRAILEGLKDEEPALKRAAARGFLQTPARPEVEPGMMQAFTSYYRQASDKLNLVNTTMLQSTQAAYQGAVADITNKIAVTQTALNVAAGETIAGVSTFNQALHGAVKKMVDNGLTGFVDSAGRNWSPEAYVAMDIRTTTANTARDAVLERNQEYGNDLYQVSTHDGARPLCYPWQGKVISISGRRGATEDLDGNQITIHSEDEIESFRYGGGLFGVNCGHYPMVFIPGFSTIKGQPQSEAENAKAYQESQQQRALERRLREEKRDLDVMKAQGASEDQIRLQKERVKTASQDIDEFCKETGRARRRDREGAPPRAIWQGINGDVTRFNGGYIDANQVPPPKAANVARKATPTQPVQPAQPAPPPQSVLTIEGKTEKLRASLSESDYREVVQMVDKSETVKLYERYGDSGGSITQKKGAGVCYRDGSVEYGLENKDGMNKYTTMAHEMGHKFDAMMGRYDGLTFNEVDTINTKAVIGSGYSKMLDVVPSSSDQFLAAIRADREGLRAILHNSAERYKMCRGDAWENATAGIQDAMDGFFGTLDKGIFHWGHGDKYYNREYNKRVVGFGLEKEVKAALKELGFDASNQDKVKRHMRDYDTASETWANAMSALTCGGQELDAFLQYMPKTIEVIRKIIGGM